jgi:hypothetical protein
VGLTLRDIVEEIQPKGEWNASESKVLAELNWRKHFRAEVRLS